MPIEPKEFPVIIKPIINLYGMGLNTKRIDNIDQFYDNWEMNGFWMSFLTGEHISWDLVILNGSIRYYISFKGYKDNDRLGRFWYWESFDNNERILPYFIKQFIRDYMIGYTGCLNMETIGDNIIECHLRMGDIDIIPTLAILRGIINTYQKLEYDWSVVKVTKSYFIPLWGDVDVSNKVFKYINKKIVPLLNDDKIHDYNIDSDSLAHPQNYRRLLWITCSDLDYGKGIMRSIKKKLNKKFKSKYFSCL
jgi:hypothetical protein